MAFGIGANSRMPSATVKQTAEALTIERTMGDATVTLTYKLDGTESRNMMMGRGDHRPIRYRPPSGTAPSSRSSPNRRWTAR